MENFVKHLIDNNIEKNLIDKLTNLLSKTKGKFYIINPKENKFRFPYLLYIPNKLESNTLILHGNNLAQEEGNIMNIYSAIFETTSSAGYDNVEFVRYPNYGHSGTPGIQHTTELIFNYRNL